MADSLSQVSHSISRLYNLATDDASTLNKTLTSLSTAAPPPPPSSVAASDALEAQLQRAMAGGSSGPDIAQAEAGAMPVASDVRVAANGPSWIIIAAVLAGVVILAVLILVVVNYAFLQDAEDAPSAEK